MTTSAEYPARYMILVQETMKRLFPRVQQRYPWIVGRYFIGAFSGSPDDMWIYYHPGTERRRTEFLTPAVEADIRAMTCDELRAAGYPATALASLKIHYPAQEEIDAAGGEFNFFR